MKTSSVFNRHFRRMLQLATSSVIVAACIIASTIALAGVTRPRVQVNPKARAHPKAQTKPRSKIAVPKPSVVNPATRPAAAPPAEERPELALQLGHSQAVFSLAYSPDGRLLASGGDDGQVKLWDATSHDLIRTLAGHTGSVFSVAFSPDSKTIASGSKDGTVKLWDVRTGRVIRQLPKQTYRVYAVAFSRDGSTLVTGSADKTASLALGELKLWDVHTGREKATTPRLSGVFSLAYTPDGSTLATGHGDGNVRLWDAATLALRQTLEGHTNLVSSVAFAPDGKTVASGSYDLSVRVWDIQTGTLRHTLTGHTGAVCSVAFSPNGKTLASGDNNSVKLWDTETGVLGQSMQGQQNRAWAVAFAPDGSTLAGSDSNSIHLWDATNSKLSVTLEDRGRFVRGIAFSPDGKTLASAGNSDNSVQIWDAQTGMLKQTLTGSRGQVVAVAFSPDGKMLASGGSQDDPSAEIVKFNEIILWDVATGKQLRKIAAHRDSIVSLSFSPDGKTIASGSDVVIKRPDGKLTEEIKLWDVATGRLLRTWDKEPGTAKSLAFSPDGRLLASGHYWNESLPYKGDGPPTPEVISKLLQLKGEVRLRDVHTGKLLRRLKGHTSRVSSIAFSPDGKSLVSGGQDATVRLWDVQTGKLRRVLSGATEWIQNVDFAADGITVAGAGNDNTIRLWDARNGKLLRTLRGHEFGIRALKFSPDGRKLASGGIDTTIRLWDVASGRELAKLLTVPAEAGSDLTDPQHAWLAVTPEGYYHCSEGVDYVVKWRFKDKLVPFYQFEETYRRPDIVRQALSGARITLRPLTLARIPPVAWILKPVMNQSVGQDSIRILIGALDDSPAPMEVHVYANGVMVPDRLAKPITTDAKPIPAEGRSPFGYLAITADGKPITTDGKDPFLIARTADGRAKPITTDGKPITTDGKPITTDGKPITTDGKVLPEHAYSHLFMTDVPLPPGEQEVLLRVTVYDNEHNRYDDAVTIRHTNTAPIKSDLYLLSVGISQYRNPTYNLKYAAADASALSEVLQQQQGRGYERVHITRLLDRQATIANIRAALKQLKDKVGPQDTVMVFLSGHGLHSNGKFYFAPWGTFVNDISGTCLEWQQIITALSEIYGKKLLFTDACHSGARLGVQQATNEQLAEAARRRTGIMMLSSSQGNEFSFEEPDLKQGAFTVALTEAFEGKADVDDSGTITLPELALYVPRRVSSLTRGLQNPQLVLVQDFNPQEPLARIR